MANNEKTDESVKRKSHETREAVLNDEHIDRAPRFQNVQDVLEHIKSDKTERAYRRKQDLIEDILSGQAREDREAILSQLLAELTTKSKKSRKERDLEENRLNPDWAKGAYPYVNRMRRKNYEEQKFRLQVELLKLQAWVKETGQKIIVIFEGRDAAGKGGTITRFMEHLNPRGARVVALNKPTVEESGQWYFTTLCDTSTHQR